MDSENLFDAALKKHGFTRETWKPIPRPRAEAGKRAKTGLRQELDPLLMDAIPRWHEARKKIFRKALRYGRESAPQFQQHFVAAAIRAVLRLFAGCLMVGVRETMYLNFQPARISGEGALFIFAGNRIGDGGGDQVD